MKNLLLIFMMLFAVDSIAQLDQREKGDVVSPALNKNPNFIQKTGWTIEAIDPINDTLCSVTSGSDNLTILTTNECNARVYQDINSADIRKARFDKETMTAFLKLQALTYVKITLNVYKKAATSGTLTLLRTRSLENNSNVPLRDKKIVFDVVTDDLNFVTNANLADSLRIEFTFEPTVVFPAGVAKVEVNDFRVFSSLLNYSALIHEVDQTQSETLLNVGNLTPTTDLSTFTKAYQKGSGIYSLSSAGITMLRDADIMVKALSANNAGASTQKGVVIRIGTTICGYQSGSAYGNDSICVASLKKGDIVTISLTGGTEQNLVQILATISTPAASQTDTGRVSEIIFTSQDYAPNNFIPANNKSIGNIGSGADYTGSDYRELYNILWNQAGTVDTAGHPYRISSAKGASAEADWAANKTITIDYVTNEVFIRAKGSARNLGSYQGDAIRNITGSIAAEGSTATGAFYSDGTAPGAGGGSGEDVIKSFDASRVVPTADENRPKNVALNAYIRYRDTMITASLLESNIKKDVEQFPLTEQKICDACYKGKAVYKRCVTESSQVTSNKDYFTLAGAKLVKAYGVRIDGGGVEAPLPFSHYSVEFSRVTPTITSLGEFRVYVTNTSYYPDSSICWEYTKD